MKAYVYVDLLARDYDLFADYSITLSGHRSLGHCDWSLDSTTGEMRIRYWWLHFVWDACKCWYPAVRGDPLSL